MWFDSAQVSTGKPAFLNPLTIQHRIVPIDKQPGLETPIPYHYQNHTGRFSLTLRPGNVAFPKFKRKALPVATDSMLGMALMPGNR